VTDDGVSDRLVERTDGKLFLLRDQIVGFELRQTHFPTEGPPHAWKIYALTNGGGEVEFEWFYEENYRPRRFGPWPEGERPSHIDHDERYIWHLPKDEQAAFYAVGAAGAVQAAAMRLAELKLTLAGGDA
jgi:hypothetical protein